MNIGKGMKTFGILMTCYLAWKRRDVSIKEMLLKCRCDLNSYYSNKDEINHRYTM